MGYGKKLTKKQIATKIRILRNHWNWLGLHISTSDIKISNYMEIETKLKNLQKKADKGDLDYID